MPGEDSTPDVPRYLFWCQLRDGQIIEHVTTSYEGHKGHRRCVGIEEVIHGS